MTAALDPSRCPLCGEANACGTAAGSGDCWCMSVTIPAEVLERVPPAALDAACVCERCATATATSPAAERDSVGGAGAAQRERRPLRVR